MNAHHLREYIIFENADIVAINKPEGMLSIPDGYDPSVPNLKNMLRNAYGEIWVVHRLDKDTSGVIVFAKNKKMQTNLNAAFSSRNVSKTYAGMIFGHPFWDEKTVEYPLLVNGDRRHRTVADTKRGKESSTRVVILQKNANYSYAEIQPHSGLTHQIRAHLAALGHPILGDNLYSYLRKKTSDGRQFCPFSEKGLYLHARSLIFNDNDLNFPILEAPLPSKYHKIWSDS